MSSSFKEKEVIVNVNGVSKNFAARLTSVRLLRFLLPWKQKPVQDDYWALRAVDFKLNRGETVGLIGRNGSGKSTLLQIIAGLMEPAEGDVSVKGRVSALLELGAGFNPEFTGRENIFLSGAIYGVSRELILERFSDIVEFADIGFHIDQPVKTYSSGMFARLAFAVAIQIDPDIILVDEILSVGDIAFQSKCFKKIEELRDKGSSIILVSHDMNSVQMFCDRAYLLHEGKILFEGKPNEATTRYLHLLMEESEGRDVTEKWEPLPNEECKAIVKDIVFKDGNGESVVSPLVGKKYTAEYKVFFNNDVSDVIVTMQLKTIMGIVVSDMTSISHGVEIPPCKKGDELLVEFSFALNVCPGPYRIGFSVAERTSDGDVPIFGTEKFTFEAIADGNAKGYGIAYTDSRLSVNHSRVTQQSINTELK